MMHNIIAIDFKKKVKIDLSQAFQIGDSFIFSNGDAFRNGVFYPGINTQNKEKKWKSWK